MKENVYLFKLHILSHCHKIRKLVLRHLQNRSSKYLSIFFDKDRQELHFKTQDRPFKTSSLFCRIESTFHEHLTSELPMWNKRACAVSADLTSTKIPSDIALRFVPWSPTMSSFLHLAIINEKGKRTVQANNGTGKRHVNFMGCLTTFRFILITIRVWSLHFKLVST